MIDDGRPAPVVVSGRPIPDVEEALAAAARASRAELVSRDGQALLALPLRGHRSPVGSLVLLGRAGSFPAATVRGLAKFAGQLAAAVQHALALGERKRMAVLLERQKLARDLHDSVCQSVYGMALFAEAGIRNLAVGDRASAAGNLERIREAGQEALRELRLLIFELHPPDLRRCGLVSVLRDRLSSVEGRAGLRTEFRAALPARLPPPVEEGFLRIALEALNNTLKHAGAGRIEVELRAGTGEAEIAVGDDGRGFDPERAGSEGGLGLRSMRERAEELGGRLEVESGAGQGARIRAVVPLPAAETGPAQPAEPVGAVP